MSLKDLFDKKASKHVLANKSVEDLKQDIESEFFVDSYIEDKFRFEPHVDYATASNFAKFGSAEEYYNVATKRIYELYPYDGSAYEKQKWINESNGLDLHVFKDGYPRSTGYAKFSPSGWGSRVSLSGNYANPATKEYILIKGGPNINNVWSTASNRTSNLEINGAKGNTVEFWLKKSGYQSLTKKEVILDVWPSGSQPGDHKYGRFTIELDRTRPQEDSPWVITYRSGSSGFINSYVSGAAGLYNSASDGEWHHYAFALRNTGSAVGVTCYVDGQFNHYFETGSTIGAINRPLIGTIGALAAGKSDNTDFSIPVNINPGLGFGKLSGSIDEFRYWKTRRTEKEISLNWFTQVHGGTNTDDSNTKLGVYYKFNEGISTSSSIDQVVLDYAGRATNASWVGYSSVARSVKSAIVESSASATEFKDPIIHVENPKVAAYIQDKKELGRAYDYSNTSNLFFSFPEFMVDEDGIDGNLKKLSQIIASYCDNLWLQIQSLSSLKHERYEDFNKKPYPFVDAMLRARGLDVPELFIDADVINSLAKRDDKKVYEQSLHDIKNFIYQNIYNNLVYIYKSKGTEKSFRNMFRCFGLDENLIRINMYADRITYPLETKYRQTSVKKRYANFSTPSHYKATIYQYSSSYASDVSPKDGFISGSHAEGTAGLAFTTQAEIIFPKKFNRSSTNYVSTPQSSSLFGAHTALGSGDTDEFRPANKDFANYEVYAVKETKDSKHAKFVLKSTSGLIDAVETAIIKDVYDNKKWNLAVRVSPKNPDFGSAISGAASVYTAELYGVQADAGTIQNEFSISRTLTNAVGERFQQYSKKIYIGAHRENYTGSVLALSDVKISSVRHWATHLDNEEIKAHAIDPASYGVLHPQQNTYAFNIVGNNSIPKIKTLALAWDFGDVTGSTAGGNLIVNDFSSGSMVEKQNYGIIGEIAGVKHPGRGFDFAPSSTSSIDVEYLFSSKMQNFENVHSSDMIRVPSRDDVTFTRETRPVNHHFSLEKSMYQGISDEMIDMFATVREFNNLIGDPIHRYRQQYKSMEHLRQLFFNNIENTPDVERYIEFYKWVDQSISDVVDQLRPATANMSDDIRNVIESHALERNKYWSKLPFLEKKQEDPENHPGAAGINELLYNWKFGHAPLETHTGIYAPTGSAGLDQSKNTFWWKNRVERTDVSVSTGDEAVDADREKLRKAINTQVSGNTFAARALSKPYRLVVQLDPVIHSGDNFHLNKKKDFYLSTTNPNNKDFIKINAADLDFGPDRDDVLRPKLIVNNNIFEKKKARGPADISNTNKDHDINTIAPFSIYSSSVDAPTDYKAELFDRFKQGVDITNLHSDAYGEDREIPMQSPFTEFHVGGHFHRHVEINHSESLGPSLKKPKAGIKGLDTHIDRVEAFYISASNSQLFVLGPDQQEKDNPSLTGSIAGRTHVLRDPLAKRPVNIRNIKTTTSSLNLGNYTHDYEIVQGTSVDVSPVFLIRTGSVVDLSVSGSSDLVLGLRDRTKLSRPIRKNVIISRFSAPGDPKTMGDSQGGPELDFQTTQYSVFNTMNYRNLSVRYPLDSFLTIAARKNYVTTNANTASFHKTYRNTNYLPTDKDTFLETGVRDQNNNAFIQRQIPQSDLNYLWITSSALETTSSFIGYSHDFTIPIGANSGYQTSSHVKSQEQTELTFVSASDVGGGKFTGFGQQSFDFNSRPYFAKYADSVGNASFGNFIPVGFWGSNAIIVDPISGSDNNTLGFDPDIGPHRVGSEITEGTGRDFANDMSGSAFITNIKSGGSYPTLGYLNDTNFAGLNLTRKVRAVTTKAGYGDQGDVILLNGLILNRQGPYGWPSWKQIRVGQDNKVARFLRKNNIYAPAVVSTFGNDKLMFPVGSAMNKIMDRTRSPEDLNSMLYNYTRGYSWPNNTLHSFKRQRPRIPLHTLEEGSEGLRKARKMRFDARVDVQHYRFTESAAITNTNRLQGMTFRITTFDDVDDFRNIRGIGNHRVIREKAPYFPENKYRMFSNPGFNRIMSLELNEETIASETKKQIKNLSENLLEQNNFRFADSVINDLQAKGVRVSPALSRLVPEFQDQAFVMLKQTIYPTFENSLKTRTIKRERFKIDWWFEDADSRYRAHSPNARKDHRFDDWVIHDRAGAKSTTQLPLLSRIYSSTNPNAYPQKALEKKLKYGETYFADIGDLYFNNGFAPEPTSSHAWFDTMGTPQHPARGIGYVNTLPFGKTLGHPHFIGRLPSRNTSDYFSGLFYLLDSSNQPLELGARAGNLYLVANRFGPTQAGASEHYRDSGSHRVLFPFHPEHHGARYKNSAWPLDAQPGFGLSGELNLGTDTPGNFGPEGVLVHNSNFFRSGSNPGSYRYTSQGMHKYDPKPSPVYARKFPETPVIYRIAFASNDKTDYDEQGIVLFPFSVSASFPDPATQALHNETSTGGSNFSGPTNNGDGFITLIFQSSSARTAEGPDVRRPHTGSLFFINLTSSVSTPTDICKEFVQHFTPVEDPSTSASDFSSLALLRQINRTVINVEQLKDNAGNLTATASITFRNAPVAENSDRPNLYFVGDPVNNNYISYHSSTGSKHDINPFIIQGPAGSTRLGGAAKWEAGSQSGCSPFPYKDYDDWFEQIKHMGRDYSQVPEFRISEFIGTYSNRLANGATGTTYTGDGSDALYTGDAFWYGDMAWQGCPEKLQLSGANYSYQRSNQENFYKVYSNSDFIRNFNVVDNAMKENGYSKRSITLTAKAIKKLLPYRGFYPVQRTLQLAEYFSSSYAADKRITSNRQNYLGSFRNYIAPFFAPGITYNSIKSGISVDYPIFVPKKDRTFNRFGTLFAANDNNWVQIGDSADFGDLLTGSLSPTPHDPGITVGAWIYFPDAQDRAVDNITEDNFSILSLCDKNGHYDGLKFAYRGGRFELHMGLSDASQYVQFTSGDAGAFWQTNTWYFVAFTKKLGNTDASSKKPAFYAKWPADGYGSSVNYYSGTGVGYYSYNGGTVNENNIFAGSKPGDCRIGNHYFSSTKVVHSGSSGSVTGLNGRLFTSANVIVDEVTIWNTNLDFWQVSALGGGGPKGAGPVQPISAVSSSLHNHLIGWYRMGDDTGYNRIEVSQSNMTDASPMLNHAVFHNPQLGHPRNQNHIRSGDTLSGSVSAANLSIAKPKFEGFKDDIHGEGNDAHTAANTASLIQKGFGIVDVTTIKQRYRTFDGTLSDAQFIDLKHANGSLAHLTGALKYPSYITGSSFNETADHGIPRIGSASWGALGGRIGTGDANSLNRTFWVNQDAGIQRVERIPFEAVIDPRLLPSSEEKEVDGVIADYLTIWDNEPHPSASLQPTTAMRATEARSYDLIYGNYAGGPLSTPANLAIFDNAMTSSALTSSINLTELRRREGAGIGTQYRLAANNFYAESMNFFLENRAPVMLATADTLDHDPTGERNTYIMTLELNRPLDGDFPMYNRASAFGPPVDAGHVPYNEMFSEAGRGRGAHGFSPFTPPHYEGRSLVTYTFTPGTGSYATPSGELLVQNVLQQIKTLDGFAESGPKIQFARLTAMTGATGEGRDQKLTKKKLATDTFRHGLGFRATNALSSLNKTHAMQLSSSIAGLDLAENALIQSFQGNDPTQPSLRFSTVFHPRWEGPSLSFKDASCTAPLPLGLTTTKGLWHQYGLPAETSNFSFRGPRTRRRRFRDLSKLLGLHFRKNGRAVEGQSKPLGQIATERRIKEAVIAVPFRYAGKPRQIKDHGRKLLSTKNQGKEFFTLPNPEKLYKAVHNFTFKFKDAKEFKKEYLDSLEQERGAPISTGHPYKKMAGAMIDYVFPPSMNWLKYSGDSDSVATSAGKPYVPPFLYFVMEFDTTLDQEDLSKIWQNLMPKIGQDSFNKDGESITQKTSFTVPLDTDDYSGDLSSGLSLLPELDTEEADEIKWMVFKVKQRAETNYFEKINRDKLPFDHPNKLPTIEQFMEYGYNWPYDYFSLVELVKIDAEVAYAVDKDDEE
jgi:hypothetical protein